MSDIFKKIVGHSKNLEKKNRSKRRVCDGEPIHIWRFYLNLGLSQDA